MSGSDSGISDTGQPDSPDEEITTAKAIEYSPTRIATASFIFFLLLYVGLLFSRWLLPGQWEFGLEVETEVASIEFQPDALTQWRIDGALLCSLADTPLPETYRIANARSVCGGRRWSGWRVDLEEQVLTLNGGATAMLEHAGNRLSVSLRTEADSLGEYAVVGMVEPVQLPAALNLFWELTPEIQSLTFPFTGATTLGRAVSWSDPGMLQGGAVAVYTSDESADRRTQVDQAELMLGDQVRLAGLERDEVWPKGFMRVGESGLLEVVAFGRADSLTIDRYGDSGYDFRPGFLARLASDPMIAFWGSMLFAYMTVIFSLIPFLEEKMVARKDVPGRLRLLRFLMRYGDRS